MIGAGLERRTIPPIRVSASTSTRLFSGAQKGLFCAWDQGLMAPPDSARTSSLVGVLPTGMVTVSRPALGAHFPSGLRSGSAIARGNALPAGQSFLCLGGCGWPGFLPPGWLRSVQHVMCKMASLSLWQGSLAIRRIGGPQCDGTRRICRSWLVGFRCRAHVGKIGISGRKWRPDEGSAGDNTGTGRAGQRAG